jgi:uncharacterized protein
MPVGDGMSDSSMVEVEVYCVRFDVFNKIPVVLLKDINAQRFLPIWIGTYEATQIEIALEKVPVPRPMSHDLMKNIADAFGISLKEIQIHSIIDGTFYARMLMAIAEDAVLEVDARPSDAIALSLRTQTPIFVAAQLIEDAAITGKAPDDDEIQKFREFISNVKPSDFKD